MIYSIANFVIALVAAPLLLGVIARVKAIFAGRNGPPLLQPYFDLIKLMRKGTVYSATTSWVLNTAPMVTLSATVCALTILPVGGVGGIVSFTGDAVMFVGLLAIARFAIVLAALDTGSAFEGMGASREVQLSVLAEPALLLALAAPALMTGTLSLGEMYGGLTSSGVFTSIGPVLILSAMALFIVFVVENSRIPVDDPNTHLELTMIHEVMILDFGGPDLGIMEYAAALKMWMLGALITGLLIPFRIGDPAADLFVGVVGVFCVAILVGIVESSMARLKLLRLPQFIIAASILAIMAVLLMRA